MGLSTVADYTDHKVVRVDLQSQAELEVLLSISRRILTDYPGVRPLEAVIPPERMDDLQRSGLGFTILHDNVQEPIDAQFVSAGAGPGPTAPHEPLTAATWTATGRSPWTTSVPLRCCSGRGQPTRHRTACPKQDFASHAGPRCRPAEAGHNH